MTRINRHAESSNYFSLTARLRTADPAEAEEIVETLATMRERSPCATIRLRCTLIVMKHRGLRAHISNGAIAALVALLVSFMVEAAALDGIITCIDRIA